MPIFANVRRTGSGDVSTVRLISSSCLLLAFVAAACGFVALHLERTSRRSFLESHLIADLAQRDALTGLKNRRVFDEHLENLWLRAGAEDLDLIGLRRECGRGRRCGLGC